MKPYLTNTALSVILMTSLSAQAQVLNKANSASKIQSAGQSVSRGGVATGGGDLCEDRIQIIRDDLKSWIVKGGAKTLQRPSGISVGKYTDDMLEQIYAAKIRCVTNGDAGYPVTVDGVPKVCRFDRSSSSLITCDLKKFEAMSEESQYRLVHHEYAGLADIERPDGSDSDYSVSNQISQNLENTVVKRMVVKSTVGFQEIPKDRIASYITATHRSVDEVANSMPNDYSFCVTDSSENNKKRCFQGWPEKLSTVSSYLKLNVQSGQVRKIGNVTEIVLITEQHFYSKFAIHYVYDGQTLRSVTTKSSKWMFPKAMDISNPPKQKEFVLTAWTTWTSAILGK